MSVPLPFSPSRASRSIRVYDAIYFLLEFRCIHYVNVVSKFCLYDIFKDLSKLEKSYKDREDGSKELEIEELEIFENVAYIMAFHADPTIPGTIEGWLDQFEMFSIYEVLPQILELWGSNLFTDVNVKKGVIPSGK